MVTFITTPYPQKEKHTCGSSTNMKHHRQQRKKYKEAPEQKAPPKYFTSSFILFYMDYHKRLKASASTTKDGKLNVSMQAMAHS